MKNRLKYLAALLAISLAPGALALEDGVYRDKAPGFGGDVIVKVIVRSGMMTEISTENTGGTKSEYYIKAEDGLLPMILEKQGIEGLDTVAGATGTSESILIAMRGIMEQTRYTGQPTQGNSSVKEPTLTPDPKPTV